MTQSQHFPDPESALAALAERLPPVTDREVVDQPAGRILAEPLRADRDSPAADVSAMDGYAVRLADLQPETALPVRGESAAGAPPPALGPGQVVRIFTGAIIPEGCQAVIRREDTEESAESIRLPASTLEALAEGANIRRAGENAPAGSEILPAGTPLTTAAVAGLANFGAPRPPVFRRVRVAILTTGNEVVDPSSQTLQPWQLRNSNQAVLQAMLRRLPFVDVHHVEHLRDDPETLRTSLAAAMEACDALLITGGVSKGDYDYVPGTLAELGAQLVFHGLPIRPGKPLLGAADNNGTLILGLPGNPVSATINAHRFAFPLLRRLGGSRRWLDQAATVTLEAPPRKAIPLHAMLLARHTGDGRASLVASKGSGDLVALSQSDGYVCLPPGEQSTGPWPMSDW